MISSTPVSFEGSEQNFLAADYWDGGGQPVIFLHGGGQTRWSWGSTAEKVAEAGMSSYVVDQRGHGESQWLENGHYSFPDYGVDAVAIAKQVAETHKITPVVVGASMGGLASLYAEQNFGPLFRSIVLVDVTPRMDETGVGKIQQFMRAHMKEGFASLEEAGDVIARYLPHRKRPSSLDGLRKNLRLGQDGRYYWHWDPNFATGERGIRYRGEAFFQGLVDGLPNMQVPTLLVRGLRSELVGEEHAREFEEATPNARTVNVGGAGHMVAGDKNDIFCEAILEFLSEETGI